MKNDYPEVIIFTFLKLEVPSGFKPLYELLQSSA